MKLPLDPILALEAKTLAALAFRNGPIENLHSGTPCSVCSGKSEFSHISNEEMKEVMKAAVNAMYRLLWQREHDPAAYLKSLSLGWNDTPTSGTNPRLSHRAKVGCSVWSTRYTKEIPECSRSLHPSCVIVLS